MKVMILGLFGVSLATALAEMLLIGREGRGIKLTLRLMTSLAILLVMLSPLMRFLHGNYDVSLDSLAGEQNTAPQEAYQTVFENAVSVGSAQLLCEGVSHFLSTEFGIDKAHATVQALFSEDGTLQTVSVRLSGGALLTNPDEISKALAEKLACRVEVR